MVLQSNFSGVRRLSSLANCFPWLCLLRSRASTGTSYLLRHLRRNIPSPWAEAEQARSPANDAMKVKEEKDLFPPIADTDSECEAFRSAGSAAPSPLIPTDGQFSSDGEFTAIAKKEIECLGDASACLENIDVNEIHSEAEATPVQIATVPVDYCNEATSSNLSTANFPGDFHFDFRIPKTAHAKDPQFSPKMGKLFIDQNRAVKIFFKFKTKDGERFPENLFIRAVAVFVKPDFFSTPVSVCHAHARDSAGKLRSVNAEHLIRSVPEEDSIYCVDKASGRYSTLTAVPNFPAGCDEVGITYRFTDLGSCPGGLNRREVAVVFTLEAGKTVVGRKLMLLRICTCVKRDMDAEEKQYEKLTVITVPNQEKGGKKKLEKRAVYWVPAYGRENFDALRKMGEFLEKKDTGKVKEYNETVNRFNAEYVKRSRLGCDESED